jgi:hypothetical protein
MLTRRHGQQHIGRLPVVPIGKQAQIRNVVACHLSSLPAIRLVQKMTGVAVMAVTERLRGN